MNDSRRSHFRRNAFRFGTLGADGAATECLVWDVSETGAMIEVETPEAVPDRVLLTLAADAPPRPCSVVRRDGRRIGLRFEDETTSPQDGSDRRP